MIMMGHELQLIHHPCLNPISYCRDARNLKTRTRARDCNYTVRQRHYEGLADWLSQITGQLCVFSWAFKCCHTELHSHTCVELMIISTAPAAIDTTPNNNHVDRKNS